ncbi:hypothetical protein FJY63_10500 [Candidatus Sumerlaeota bacterium]|nr:hypothetical protein [Candidatus Sumerlaeota bacterium]
MSKAVQDRVRIKSQLALGEIAENTAGVGRISKDQIQARATPFGGERRKPDA